MRSHRRSLSERAYALLQRLLPSDIRETYGADMRALFRDHLREERRRAGIGGVVGLWLRTIPDLVYTAIHERERDMLTAISQDARYAGRILRKQPLFTFVAIAVVAVGVGAVSTIVSVANAVVLRPIPGVARPNELVIIDRMHRDRVGSTSVSYPYYQHLARESKRMRGIAAWDVLTLTISTGGEGLLAQSNLITGNYFEVLGARPALGRFFAADEDVASNPKPVVVISHSLWERRFSGDSSIVGHTVLVNSRPFTVIGVAPPHFSGLYPVMRIDAWVPMAMQPSVRPGGDLLTSAESGWLQLFGRLAPGVSRDAAQAELIGLTERFAASSEQSLHGDATGFTGIRLTTPSGLPGDATKSVVTFFAILIVVAGLVLAIASVNVATMLLARAAMRRREIAIRMALGAARSRLVRQLLTESVILFAAGGAAGALLAVYATRLLSRIQLPVDVQLNVDPSPDARVLVATILVALGTGIVFGLFPALDGSRADVATAMRGDSAGAGRARSRLRSVLIAGQVAASLLLLTTSGLFVRALAKGHRVDPGYDVGHVATTALNVSLSGYDSTRARALYAAVHDRLRALDKVTAVSFARVLPLSMTTTGYGISVPGYTPTPAEASRGLSARTNIVSAEYFDALHLPIVAGRKLMASDDARAPRVAVVSQLFARTFWPGQNPLGHTFTLGDTNRITVVGVARDVKFANLTETPAPFMYLPLAQNWYSAVTLLVRTTGDPDALAKPIRDVVHSLDPKLPPTTVVSLEDAASVVLLPQRFAVMITATLGGLGLLLASIGLYGVVSFSTAQRTREIGVRMALGATAGDVVRLVVREGMGVVVIGIAIGLAAGALATQVLRPLLFGIDPLDGVTFLTAPLLLAGAALVASIVPARRAAAADPVLALRQD
jgi:predicted permease